LRKSAGTGTTSIGGPFHNSGTVVVQSGVLALANGGSLGGTLQADTGAAVSFAAGVFRLSGTSGWQGPGAVGLTGGSLVLDSVSGIVDVYGGVFTGSIASGGVLNWRGGALNYGAPLTVEAQGVVNVLGDASVIGPLTNRGTIHWQGGVLYIENDGGVHAGVLWNEAGGVIDVQCDQVVRSTAGTGPIYNAGTLRKSAGTGTTSIGGPFHNSGSVEIQSGSIHLAGACSWDPGADLSLAIGGGAAGAGLSQLQVDGATALAGALAVHLADGFVPNVGGLLQVVAGPCSSGFSNLSIIDAANRRVFPVKRRGDGVWLQSEDIEGPPMTLRPLGIGGGQFQMLF
jgi:hypothetical protein